MNLPALAAALLLSVIAGCSRAETPAAAPDPAQNPTRQTAVFAGGCFWCTEADFEAIPGVIEAVSGYAGGRAANPTYREVVAGGTGHLEAVRVTFDPARVSYRTLVDRFWRTIDPTDAGGQFCDRGESYAPAVFVTPAQRADAEASRRAAAAEIGESRFRTPIRPAARFWPAEAEHQDYARRNPLRYRVYRQGCGRDARLRALWR